MRTLLFYLVGILGLSFSSVVSAQSTPLDPSVRVVEEKDQVTSVFRDIVVVQRKAKDKAGSFLFHPGISFDFSDGPISMYTLNANLGYALSDFWEIYLNLVPAFLVQERAIVKKVGSLQLAEDRQATITYAKPKTQYGVEILWLPAYGKDSWSPYRIVRSDTFFKFGWSQINYDQGTGGKAALLLGKTYFLSNWMNLRLAAGFNYVQTIVDEEKKFNGVAVLESGLVFYF